MHLLVGAGVSAFSHLWVAGLNLVPVGHETQSPAKRSKTGLPSVQLMHLESDFLRKGVSMGHLVTLLLVMKLYRFMV